MKITTATQPISTKRWASPVRDISVGYEAIVSFLFDDKEKLKSVTLTFNSPGTDVDLNKMEFIETKTKNAENIYKFMLDRLKEKYGEPKITNDKFIMWSTDNETTITLGIEPSVPNSNNSTTLIVYQKLNEPKKFYYGL